MKRFRTHYQNLQVQENASDEVIKGAYKYLSQKWHPDKNPTNRDEAERITRIINEAYDVLSDPAHRAQHDNWIRDQEKSANGNDLDTPSISESSKSNINRDPGVISEIIDNYHIHAPFLFVIFVIVLVVIFGE